MDGLGGEPSPTCAIVVYEMRCARFTNCRAVKLKVVELRHIVFGPSDHRLIPFDSSRNVIGDTTRCRILS